ncbi:MAG: hypothetical protein M9902_08705 [Thermomonas sp.]|nr:hypothetical protein [Thermomonas sp.]MCO5055660.1 hypothetical protein [Thermomonas sp.]
MFLTPGAHNPGGRINSYLEKAIAAEPVERKFLKALKTKDIEALDFAASSTRACARAGSPGGTQAAGRAARPHPGHDHRGRFRPARAAFRRLLRSACKARTPRGGLTDAVGACAVSAAGRLAGGALAVLAAGVPEGAVFFQHRAADRRAGTGTRDRHPAPSPRGHQSHRHRARDRAVQPG